MIGSGMPISQSNAPFPKPMVASIGWLREGATPPASLGSVYETPGSGTVATSSRL
jgi:hypothetical protein